MSSASLLLFGGRYVRSVTNRIVVVVARSDPGVQVVAAVEDAAAEPEAAGAGVAVPPVPQGGDGCAQRFGCFGDGEQLGVVAVGVVGHVWLLAWSGVVALHL